MPLLVAPVANFAVLQAGVKFIEHIVFPQHAMIFRAQRAPATPHADKTGIETIHLGRRHDFGGAAMAEGAQYMHHMGCLQHRQIIVHRRTTRLALAGKTRCLVHAAALHQQQFEKLLEGVALFEPEQFLNIARPVSIQPLLVIAFDRFPGNKERRQATALQALLQRAAEGSYIRRHHRGQPEIFLAPGQCVAKPRGGAQGRRTRGQYPRPGEVIRRDLEQFRRIWQSMNFVQHHPAPSHIAQEQFRISQASPHAGQLAIEILAIGQRKTQLRLPCPAYPGQPDHRPPPPGSLNALQPISSTKHK